MSYFQWRQLVPVFRESPKPDELVIGRLRDQQHCQHCFEFWGCVHCGITYYEWLSLTEHSRVTPVKDKPVECNHDWGSYYDNCAHCGIRYSDWYARVRG